METPSTTPQQSTGSPPLHVDTDLLRPGPQRDRITDAVRTSRRDLVGPHDDEATRSPRAGRSRHGGYASSDRTPDQLPKVAPGPAPGARWEQHRVPGTGDIEITPVTTASPRANLDEPDDPTAIHLIEWSDPLGYTPPLCGQAPVIDNGWHPRTTIDPTRVTCHICATIKPQADPAGQHTIAAHPEHLQPLAHFTAGEDGQVRVHPGTWTTPHTNSQLYGIETLMPTSPSKPQRPIEQLTVTTGNGATITLSGQDILGGYDLEHDLAAGILRVALCDVRVVEVTYADGRVQ